MLNTTLKPIVCRSTSSSVQAWSSERDRNAALSPSARILVNAPMGSSIAGRTPWRKCQPTFPRTPLSCKWNRGYVLAHCVYLFFVLKFISRSSSSGALSIARTDLNKRSSFKSSRCFIRTFSPAQLDVATNFSFTGAIFNLRGLVGECDTLKYCNICNILLYVGICVFRHILINPTIRSPTKKTSTIDARKKGKNFFGLPYEKRQREKARNAKSIDGVLWSGR